MKGRSERRKDRLVCRESLSGEGCQSKTITPEGDWGGVKKDWQGWGECGQSKGQHLQINRAWSLLCQAGKVQARLILQPSTPNQNAINTSQAFDGGKYAFSVAQRTLVVNGQGGEWSQNNKFQKEPRNRRRDEKKVHKKGNTKAYELANIAETKGQGHPITRAKKKSLRKKRKGGGRGQSKFKCKTNKLTSPKNATKKKSTITSYTDKKKKEVKQEGGRHQDDREKSKRFFTKIISSSIVGKSKEEAEIT